MDKITDKEYKLFQTYCKEYQKMLGLENWSLVFHFGFEPEDAKDFYNACVKTDIQHYQADIYFDKNYKPIDSEELDESIRNSAKHEMIHILLARLAKLGSYRYSVTTMDMEAAEEELIHKMEFLIK